MAIAIPGHTGSEQDCWDAGTIYRDQHKSLVLSMLFILRGICVGPALCNTSMHTDGLFHLIYFLWVWSNLSLTVCMNPQSKIMGPP